MLAGVLHSTGYYMGEQLLPATSSNPKGYFEDRALNNLNEDLLVQLVPVKPLGPRGRLYPWRLSYGHLWLVTLDVNASVPTTSELEMRMRHIVNRPPFCFKDPRFCYTLDAWRPVLGDAIFLCVFREPGRTATSMITDSRERTYLRGLKLTRRRALGVWTSMYQHVLDRHSKRGQWLFVHYDQILDGSAIPRLEHVLETKIDTSFIDASLKRSHDSHNLPKRTLAIYQRLCSLAGIPWSRTTIMHRRQ
jgi:hypothetical protein